MFIRRTDLIDQFAANFRGGIDSDIVFQPRESDIPVPVSAEEYDATMSAFERVQMTNMAITWIVLIVASCYGFYKVAHDNQYMPFVMSFALACLFSVLIHARDGINLLLPFVKRRDAIKKQMESDIITPPNS